MTTAVSYSSKKSNKFLYKNSLKQGFSFAIVSGVISFIAIFIPFLLAYNNSTRYGYDANYWLSLNAEGVFMFSLSEFIPVLIAFISFIAALVFNSYMHGKKQVDLYHSLPVTRTQLLNANTLAGLTTVLLPYIIVVAVTMIAQSILLFRYLQPSYFIVTLQEIVLTILYSAAVYAFVTFVAANVGTIFDNFAIAGALGFSPIAIIAIFISLVNDSYYGINISYDNIMYLCPYILSVGHTGGTESGRLSPYLKSIIASVLFLVVFYILAVFSYKRRKSEIAETKGGNSWAYALTKVFAVIIASMLFYIPMLFSSLGTLMAVIISLIVGLGVGLITEIILSRGVKGLASSFKWLGVGAIAFLIFITSVQFDLFGIETRVPSVNSIKSVQVYYNDRAADSGEFPSAYYRYRDVDRAEKLTDPETFEIITNAHKEIVSSIPGDEGLNSSGYAIGRGDDSEKNYVSNQLSILYTLKSGKQLERSYYYMIDSAAEELAKLETSPEYIKTRQIPFMVKEDGYIKPDNITSLTLSSLLDERVIENISKEDYLTIIEAIQQDMLNEPLEEILNPSTQAIGAFKMEFNAYYRYDKEGNGIGSSDQRQGSFLLNAGFTNTINTLKSLGYSQVISTKEPEYDRVEISDISYIVQSGKVNVFLPNSNYSPLNSYSPGYSDFDITDAKQIQQMMNNTQAQAYVNILPREGYISYYLDYQWLALSCYKDGKQIASRAISIDNMPTEIQEEILQRLKQSETESQTYLEDWEAENGY